MKTVTLVLIAVVGVVLLASTVAAAGSAVTKQRVVVTSELARKRTFGLVPFGAGALKRDSGTVTVDPGSSREVVRDGQKVGIFLRAVYTFDGKLGSFTIRERTEWVEVSNVNTQYG